MPEDKFVQVIVRMPKKMHDDLKRNANINDRTMAATVRRAVRQYLSGKG